MTGNEQCSNVARREWDGFILLMWLNGYKILTDRKRRKFKINHRFLEGKRVLETDIWFSNSSSALISCATMGKFLNLSVLQFPHLSKWGT